MGKFFPSQKLQAGTQWYLNGIALNSEINISHQATKEGVYTADIFHLTVANNTGHFAFSGLKILFCGEFKNTDCR
ncbi:MAG: hypothetical protein ABI675_28125 [Chitinophagaceae bacterium]